MGYFLWSGTGAIEELEDCQSDQAALAELQDRDCDCTLWYRGEGFCRARLVAAKTLAPPLLLGEHSAEQPLGLPTTNPSTETTRSVMDAFRAAECRAPNPGEVMGQIIQESHPPPLRPLTNWPEGFDLGGDHD